MTLWRRRGEMDRSKRKGKKSGGEKTRSINVMEKEEMKGRGRGRRRRIDVLEQ